MVELLRKIPMLGFFRDLTIKPNTIEGKLDKAEFDQLLEKEIPRLFEEARQKDELSFLFAVLGINSGMEDAGWQPIGETHALVNDLIGLINAPLHSDTKVRLMLFLYCHITEADFLYHCLYNLLLTIEGQPPKMFSFLDLYRNGIPPSFSKKLSEIKKKASKNGFESIESILEEIVRSDIRNAFYHSDYILFENEMRLKHNGYQIVSFPEVIDLVDKAMSFFNFFFAQLVKARSSFQKGHKITGRKTPNGEPLSSVDVTVDDNGIAIGFSTSDPLPVWGE